LRGRDDFVPEAEDPPSTKKWPDNDTVTFCTEGTVTARLGRELKYSSAASPQCLIALPIKGLTPLRALAARERRGPEGPSSLGLLAVRRTALVGAFGA
jgi:hypothetical protein